MRHRARPSPLLGLSFALFLLLVAAPGPVAAAGPTVTGAALTYDATAMTYAFSGTWDGASPLAAFVLDLPSGETASQVVFKSGATTSSSDCSPFAHNIGCTFSPSIAVGAHFSITFKATPPIAAGSTFTWHATDDGNTTTMGEVIGPTAAKSADLALTVPETGLWFSHAEETGGAQVFHELFFGIGQTLEGGSAGWTHFARFAAGDTIDVLVEVKNLGDDPAHGYTVTVSAGATYKGWSREVHAVNPSRNLPLQKGSLPTLEKFGRIYLVYSVPSAEGKQSFMATVKPGGQTDPNPSNNSASKSYDVAPSMSSTVRATATGISGTTSVGTGNAPRRALVARLGTTKIAVLETSGSKCAWLTNHSGVFQTVSAANCRAGRFLATSGSSTWSYSLSHLPSPKITVAVFVQAKAGGVPHEEFATSLHDLFKLRI